MGLLSLLCFFPVFGVVDVRSCLPLFGFFVLGVSYFCLLSFVSGVVGLSLLSLACMFGFVLVLVVGVVGKCLVLLVSVC